MYMNSLTDGFKHAHVTFSYLQSGSLKVTVDQRPNSPTTICERMAGHTHADCGKWPVTPAQYVENGLSHPPQFAKNGLSHLPQFVENGRSQQPNLWRMAGHTNPNLWRMVDHVNPSLRSMAAHTHPNLRRMAGYILPIL